MDLKSVPDNNVIDNFYDEIVDYVSFHEFLKSSGINIENDLNFHGNIEEARSYVDINYNNVNEVNYDNEYHADEKTVQIFQNEVKTGNFPEENDFQSGASQRFEASSFPIYSQRQLNSNIKTLQQPYETRSKYLLRFPKLFEEYFNSGNLEMVKVLYYDVFSPNVVYLTKTLPPATGVQKHFDIVVSVHKYVPDACVFHNQIARVKKRLITTKGNSFGTILNTVLDKTAALWNLYEYSTMDSLDEHHKIQKLKYDELKAQNKLIRFERRATWHYILSRDLRHVVKFMCVSEVTDIFG